MRLQLETIDDNNIKVLSKTTGKHAGNIIRKNINSGEWVFRAIECGCVWETEVIFELATKIEQMNKNEKL
jgi:hypothetical protein